jgi:hypothetical protein
MDNFESARQALRDTPVYREACQTEHVMSDRPRWVANARV